MEIGLTSMSTKGQIVIPRELRAEFNVGEKLVVIKSSGKLIIKKASDLDKEFEADVKFAKKTEEVYKRIKEGKGTTMEFDDFIDEMKTW